MYTSCVLCFFFNDTATTEIYTLSLHDALPISHVEGDDLRAVAEEHGWEQALTANAYLGGFGIAAALRAGADVVVTGRDRKSTRLNSSHPSISYAVFCLKKKKKKQTNHR